MSVHHMLSLRCDACSQPVARVTPCTSCADFCCASCLTDGVCPGCVRLRAPLPPIRWLRAALLTFAIWAAVIAWLLWG